MVKDEIELASSVRARCKMLASPESAKHRGSALGAGTMPNRDWRSASIGPVPIVAFGWTSAGRSGKKPSGATQPGYSANDGQNLEFEGIELLLGDLRK